MTIHVSHAEIDRLQRLLYALVARALEPSGSVEPDTALEQEAAELALLLGSGDPARDLRLSDSGVSLLRVAAEAAANTAHRIDDQRRTIMEISGALSEAVGLLDRAGRLLHRNGALERLLTDDPEAELVVRELERGAAVLSAFAERSERNSNADAVEKGPAKPPPSLGRIIQTARRRYQIRLFHSDQRIFSAGGTVVALVSVEAEEPPGSDTGRWRTRFGLSPREVEVAELVSRGASAKQVAAELGISVHTARRHTERLMKKLGVRTRAAVWARLREAEALFQGPPDADEEPRG